MPDSTPLFPSEYNPRKMSWGHQWMNLPLIWNDTQTMGEGQTIAVIDTGIHVNHPDLISRIDPRSRSFLGHPEDLQDRDGHGTNMAGIIAATGEQYVYGVAPQSKLVVVKAAERSRGAEVAPFIQALEFVASLSDVSIISFSQVFMDDPNLKRAIQACLDRGKFIFAAIGNGHDLESHDQPDPDQFPACYDGVVSVGAFDVTGDVCSFSNWNDKLGLLAPGDLSVLTCGINGRTARGGQTSIATAFTAGCFALVLSFASKNQISPDDCIPALLSQCDDVGPTIGKDIHSGFGRLNLRNALKSLKF